MTPYTDSPCAARLRAKPKDKLTGVLEMSGIKSGQVWELPMSANGYIPPGLFRVVSISNYASGGFKRGIPGHRVYLYNINTGKIVNRSMVSLLSGKDGSRKVSE